MIYAIGDLHLSLAETVEPGEWDLVKEYKPMGIFGDNWDRHYQKIFLNWNRKVGRDDYVLVPGDISWAENLDQAAPDFDFIGHLPGKKIFIRGNHDYWWQGIKKMRNLLPDDFILIQNDSVNLGETAVAGSRGWVVPNKWQFSSHDEKIYIRELMRLEMSLESIDPGVGTKIVMLHYMPVNEDHEKNELIELLQAHKVNICIYGHLHGAEAHQARISGERWGILFKLVSADFLNFDPKKILE